MKALRHPLLHRLLGLALGAVFVYASLDKIADPRAFAKIVYHYQVIGPSHALAYWPANLLAVTLPWVELLVGLLLAIGLWRREAAAVCSVMLMAFLLAVGSALLRGIDVQNCGCFSVTGEGRRAGVALLTGDTALLLGALLLAGLPPAPRREAEAPLPEMAR